MIYASDLDRTLIYSERFLEGYFEPVIPVERDSKGKVISYIPQKALENLREISSRIEFVPVTTRSIREYTRTLFCNMTSFAIVDNGGTILYFGAPVEEWEQKIAEQLQDYDLNSVVKLFEGQPFVSRAPSIVDGKFVFLKQMDETACRKFCVDNLNLDKYTFEIQRKKVYIIPKFISKRSALEFLMHTKKSKFAISSGDSALDEGMINLSNFAIVPKHGTVNFANISGSNYIVTEAEGIESANEITAEVLEKID